MENLYVITKITKKDNYDIPSVEILGTAESKEASISILTNELAKDTNEMITDLWNNDGPYTIDWKANGYIQVFYAKDDVISVYEIHPNITLTK